MSSVPYLVLHFLTKTIVNWVVEQRCFERLAAVYWSLNPKSLSFFIPLCRKKNNKKEKDEEEGAEHDEDSDGEYTQVSPDYHGRFIYASEADKDATYQ